MDLTLPIMVFTCTISYRITLFCIFQFYSDGYRLVNVGYGWYRSYLLVRFLVGKLALSFDAGDINIWRYSALMLVTFNVRRICLGITTWQYRQLFTVIVTPTILRNGLRARGIRRHSAHAGKFREGAAFYATYLLAHTVYFRIAPYW